MNDYKNLRDLRAFVSSWLKTFSLLWRALFQADELAEGDGDSVKWLCGNEDGVPFLASLFHALAVAAEVGGNEGVVAAVVADVDGQVARPLQVVEPVGEDEHAQGVGAEDRFPVFHAVDVVEGGPALAEAFFAVGGGRELAAFDIDDDFLAVFGMDDEVETLEFGAFELCFFRLIDGNIGNTAGLQPEFKGPLIVCSPPGHRSGQPFFQ